MQAAIPASAPISAKTIIVIFFSVDAGKLGGLRVAAGGVHIAAKPGPPREEGHDEPGHKRDEHRNRVACGDDQSPSGTGLFASGGRDPLRPR